jgi:hypothetical protein
MNIALFVLAVALAAACVWLTVRFVNRRERWPKWTAIFIAVLALYVASWIPMARLAEWLAVRDLLPDWAGIETESDSVKK